MAVTQPVPNWADPVIGNKEVMDQLGIKFNPVWLNWFLTLIQDITSGSFINHNTLNGLQGGDIPSDEFYHLTHAQANLLSATQLANKILAGPATGAAAAAAFRSLVTADFPLSGATAAIYGSATQTPQIAVDATGRITAAANVTVTPAAASLTGQVSEAHGGTNQSTYAQGDTLYASAANTLAKLAIGSSDKFIKSTGTIPAWASITAADISDYATGAWTPVVTSGTGSITTVGAVSGTYTKIGRLVYATYDITITTNGTGATFILASGLPYTADATAIGPGAEIALTGNMTRGQVTSGTAALSIRYYDATYPGGDGAHLVGSVTYIGH